MANYKEKGIKGKVVGLMPLGRDPEMPRDISPPISGVPNYSPSDAAAFEAMNNVTKSAPDTMFKDDRVFTESLYNTQATSEERGDYDRRSYDALREIFKADRKRDQKLKNWSFQRYLKNLKSSYLEEIIMSEDHPINLSGEMRPSYERLLSTVYEGDVDQLKLSAWNIMQEKPTKDRSNIPAGEKY